MHKLGTGRDYIAVKLEAMFIFRLFIVEDDLVTPVRLNLSLSNLLLLGFFSRAESTRPLLI